MGVRAGTLKRHPVEAGSGEPGLYERDVARWAAREAALIRAGRLSDADLENLAEEIDSLGREQFARVQSHLGVILLHLLKWDHQPDRRTRSWTLSIRDSRIRVETTVDMSPSLKRRRQEAANKAYRGARLRAALETDLPLSTFPETCPYGLDEILDRPIRWHDD